MDGLFIILLTAMIAVFSQPLQSEPFLSNLVCFTDLLLLLALHQPCCPGPSQHGEYSNLCFWVTAVFFVSRVSQLIWSLERRFTYSTVGTGLETTSGPTCAILQCERNRIAPLLLLLLFFQAFDFAQTICFFIVLNIHPFLPPITFFKD